MLSRDACQTGIRVIISIPGKLLVVAVVVSEQISCIIPLKIEQVDCIGVITKLLSPGKEAQRFSVIA